MGSWLILDFLYSKGDHQADLFCKRKFHFQTSNLKLTGDKFG